MNTPRAGGHRKPGSAAKQPPSGYDHLETCPTCNGSGKVSKAERASVIEIAKRRA